MQEQHLLHKFETDVLCTDENEWLFKKHERHVLYLEKMRTRVIYRVYDVIVDNTVLSYYVYYIF